MKTAIESDFQTTAVTRVAGEDVKPGDYVTVVSELIELPSFLWYSSGTMLPMDEPVRTRFVPREAGQPFKVVAVCLPFVYAERACKKVATLDIRNQQLVRLDPESGHKVWKLLRAALKSKRE